MKSIFNKIFMGTAVLGLTMGTVSCNDMLDLKPQGQIIGEQIDTTAVTALMSSAYAGLECHFFGNNESFAGPITNWVMDVRSDDAYKGGGGVSMEAYIHQLEIGNVTSDNPTCLFKWENNYYAISRVHKAMNAIENSNLQDKAALLGELKTLRAWFYFDLNRVFKNIAYFDETEDPNSKSTSEFTKAEIYDKIKKDLQDAYNVLPETVSQPGRFNKYVAAAIMAKVCAQTSDWANVITYGDYVIKSGKYQLYDNFGDMSKLAFNNKKEAVLAIQFSTANNNAHINYNNLLNTTYSDGNLFGNGDDFFLGSQNLVNAFKTDKNGLPYLNNDAPADNLTDNYDGNVDPRLDFTVGRIGFPFRGHTYSKGWCRAYDVYGEYSGKKGLIDPSSPDMVKGFPWGASGLNFNLIRYADILLLKAEAEIELNQNLDDARNLINQVRQKAARSVDAKYSPVDVDPNKAYYAVGQYPATGWTQDYARKAVRMERRLELAMEGNRWFDLIRWGNVVTTVNSYMSSEAKLRPYYQGASLSEDKVYLPVPVSEVDNSHGLYK
ncbi:MAG: RagB/SusD family nutrient uptake outer membrane protein [Prevotella sp.]|nr:RagB/SusD family nutrient uptake outer membrane protein [Prevotella sp.]